MHLVVFNSFWGTALTVPGFIHSLAHTPSRRFTATILLLLCSATAVAGTRIVFIFGISISREFRQAGSAVQSVCLLHCSSFCRHCRQPALLSAEASSSLSAVCAPVACGSQSVSRFSWFSSPLTDGAQSAARLLALLVFKIVVCVFSHVC